MLYEAHLFSEVIHLHLLILVRVRGVDPVRGQNQPSPFGHIPAEGIELGLGQFRRPRLPVLPAVDSGVADTKMTSQIFLAQRQLPADLFYQRRKITVFLFHPGSPIKGML